jgi:hypothetical protein
MLVPAIPVGSGNHWHGHSPGACIHLSNLVPLVVPVPSGLLSRRRFREPLRVVAAQSQCGRHHGLSAALTGGPPEVLRICAAAATVASTGTARASRSLATSITPEGGPADSRTLRRHGLGDEIRSAVPGTTGVGDLAASRTMPVTRLQSLRLVGGSLASVPNPSLVSQVGRRAVVAGPRRESSQSARPEAISGYWLSLATTG